MTFWWKKRWTRNYGCNYTLGLSLILGMWFCLCGHVRLNKCQYFLAGWIVSWHVFWYVWGVWVFPPCLNVGFPCVMACQTCENCSCFVTSFLNCPQRAKSLGWQSKSCTSSWSGKSFQRNLLLATEHWYLIRLFIDLTRCGFPFVFIMKVKLFL